MKAIKIVLISIGVLLMGSFGIKWTADFFKIDACLDKGCRWNYTLNKCECSDSTSSTDNERGINSDIYGVVEVREKSAVIFMPDSLKILQTKKDNEKDFYVAADDATFYLDQARKFLNNHSVKIIETDVRLIDFYHQQKLLKRFDLNTGNKFWGLILFNGKDIPEEVELVGFESEFDRIMK